MDKSDRHLTVCLDMHGCPNRCRHCWLGDLPNRKIKEGYDEFIVGSFKWHFPNITFYSWLREPDFCPDYKDRWIKDNALSTISPKRFELASFFRIARDEEYVNWLKEVGTKKVQLTFFGLERTTDGFVGRKGAYKELLQATRALKSHGIEPRWQIFLYQTNKQEAVCLLDIANQMGVKEVFVHEGSCDGNNRKLYDIRIDKNGIPELLKPYYLNYPNLLSEKECIAKLKDDETPYLPHNEKDITLYITSDLNVYFNFTNPSPAWRIGNIEQDGIDAIAEKTLNEDILALKLAKTMPIKELVRKYGDPNSDKVFSLDDYKMYLLNNYLNERR